MLGVIGTKLGMTRVFKDNGTSVPVTVIEVAKSKIVQRKTPEKDGYYAVQVNFGSKKKVSKSLEKKFKDSDAKKGYLTEFNLSEEEFNFLQDAKEITLHPFSETKKVDVSGVSKGKGFAGVVKRDITLRHKMQHTVILLLIEPQVQLGNVNFLEEYSKERKWLVIWGIKIQLFRTWKLKK